MTRTAQTRAKDLAWLASARAVSRFGAFTVVWSGFAQTKRGKVANGPEVTAQVVRRLVCDGMIRLVSHSAWDGQGVQGYQITLDGFDALSS